MVIFLKRAYLHHAFGFNIRKKQPEDVTDMSENCKIFVKCES
jgi:hypothetical protein